MTEPLVLVERDDPIAVVLMNRPKQLNALSDELMDAEKRPPEFTGR